MVGSLGNVRQLALAAIGLALVALGAVLVRRRLEANLADDAGSPRPSRPPSSGSPASCWAFRWRPPGSASEGGRTVDFGSYPGGAPALGKERAMALGIDLAPRPSGAAAAAPEAIP